MLSVKRIFVAGVVSLFIALSSSYTGKATQQTSVDRDELSCADGLKAYLQANLPRLTIYSLSIDNCELDAKYGVNEDVKIIEAKYREYLGSHPECTCSGTLTWTMNLCSSSDECPLTFKGTMRDQGKDPYIVGIKPGIIVKLVSAEAKQQGVMTKGLRLELKRDNKGNHFLLFSGEFSASKGRALQGRQIVLDVLKKYTGGLNIKANLKELPAQR